MTRIFSTGADYTGRAGFILASLFVVVAGKARSAQPAGAGLAEARAPRPPKRLDTRRAVPAMLLLGLLCCGCDQKWDMTQRPVSDEELDSAFFSGLDAEVIADVPEPRSLRPCCI